MKTLKAFLPCCALCLATLAFAGHAVVWGNPQTRELSALERIQADFAAGLISDHQRIVLSARAVRAPADLPLRYRQDAGAVAPADRCALAVMREAAQALPSMSGALRSELTSLLSRPDKTVSYNSPGEHFKLHYDTTGTHAVPAADTNSNMVPDFIERIAQLADTAWSVHIDESGYLPPPSDDTAGGDSRYDIYFEKFSFFGYVLSTTPGANPWNDYASYMVLHHTFENFPPNDDPEGDAIGSAKATLGHEFFHALQLAYDRDDELWFMESSATWSEEILFDATNDNYQFLPDFFTSPHTALTAATDHFYSTFIFPLYLSQTFDTTLMRRVWEGARYATAFETLADTLPAVHGATRDDAFREFVTWLGRTGVRDDGLGFEEASGYPDVSVGATVSTYPALNVNSSPSPSGYGSTWIRFLPGAQVGDLLLHFDGFDGRAWDAHLFATQGTAVHEVQRFALDDLRRGVLRVQNIENYSEIRLVGANVTAYSSSVPYKYSAEIISGAALGVAPVGDSVAFTLAPNPVGIRITNFGAATDSFTVAASDNAGWTLDGPAEPIVLAPDTDTLVIFTATPPGGTLPGSLSQVTLTATSQSDPAVLDSVTRRQFVSLQHGDANWDGKINIQDATHLIFYFFLGGPGGQPQNESADTNCNNKVNIEDVTSIIAYIFNGGPAPPCNAVDPF
ncbi:MAG TPA: dockerin type I repeat-containing protein [candidate division Zixibacteria bacterium]|nr:dockerin type I repeat-containing protein [candidate division Zixibacteria bacterium]